ncbi:MAG: sulfite exporter TauE/SafE family protein [Rubrobacteraceae bacterium]
MGLVEIILLAISGLLGGFINTLAGNGSAFTLPALEFAGLPDDVANGTNRLSIVALGLVGTVSFYRRGLIDWRESIPVVFVVSGGTIVGSFVAIGLSTLVLDIIIVIGLLVVLGLLLFRPQRWILGGEGEPDLLDLRQTIVYFLIGIYAGVIVLGAAFFMLAALVMITGFDLGRANALKVLLLLVGGLLSLLIFAESGEVDWAAGVPLALGSAIGAYGAALLSSQEWAKVWLYRFLVLVVIVAIVHLLVRIMHEVS